MIIKRIVLLLLIFISVKSSAAIIYDTLYINKAPHTIGIFTYQACVFNGSENFVVQNEIIEIAAGDVLELHVVNNDSLNHVFRIDGIVENNNLIVPNGFKNFTLNFSSLDENNPSALVTYA